MTIRRFLPFVVLVCSIAFIPCEQGGLAQPKPPDLKPNPLAPTIKTTSPPGGTRGTTVDVNLVGTNLAEPTTLWNTFAGKVTVPTDNKDATKFLAKIEIPKDAAIGFHGLRAVTSKGVSNVRIFCVDDLPQVIEDGKNTTPETAQKVAVPSVVVGKVDTEGKDYFKFSVKAGESLSFELLGRRLGSALDPQITLLDSKGRDLPSGHSNDAPGRLTDPALRYTFKTAGDYLVEVRDVAYKGGDDFFYRLRIGDFPLATTTFPLAAKRGSKVQVNFVGPFATGIQPIEVTVPTDPYLEEVSVAPKGASGLHGWPVGLILSDFEEVTEKEPNNDAAKATVVPVPCGVSGRFEARGDVDFYRFKAEKGRKLILDCQTTDVGSPTEVLLTVRDGKGAQVGASDPMKGPRVELTPAADGEFTVQAEHLHYWGGPSESYRLTIVPSEPGFDLSVPLDRFEIRPGAPLTIPVTVVRRDNPGEIVIKVVGPPELTGEVKVPAMNPPATVNLAIQAAAGLAAGPTTFRIVGTTTSNGKTITETASVRVSLSGQMANLQLPPRVLTRQFGLMVLDPAPFVLTSKLSDAETTPGKDVEMTVTAERRAGFKGEIGLTVTGLPANAKADAKAIPADKNESKFKLTIPMNAAVGAVTIVVQGKGTNNGKEAILSAPGVALNVKK